MSSRARVLSVLGAIAVAGALAGPGPAGAVQPSPPRIVAIGDIHGSLDGLEAILRAAALLDEDGRWAGGTAHLVQTGDYTDRGDRVRDVMDLLMRLEGEARRAGGRADILLGNHEVMNLLVDLRDVSPGTYAEFADGDSEARRRDAYRAYVKVMSRRGAPVLPEAQWNEKHPPGFVEYVDALGPEGHYGTWLRERKVVVREAGTIFMHAGLSETAPGSLDEVNRTASRELASWDRTRELLAREGLITPYFTLPETLDAIVAEIRRIAAAFDAKEPPGDHVTQLFVQELQAAAQIGRSSLAHADGPLWFRGYALWPETEAAKVAALLERYEAERFVTGHTTMVTGITSRFDGRVLLIDTGMLSSHYTGGRPAALEIAGDAVTAIYTDRRDVLSGTARQESVAAPQLPRKQLHSY